MKSNPASYTPFHKVSKLYHEANKRFVPANLQKGCSVSSDGCKLPLKFRLRSHNHFIPLCTRNQLKLVYSAVFSPVVASAALPVLKSSAVLTMVL